MCDEWYNHKKRKLLKELNNGKVESHEILISNLPKFNLMDYISAILFIDNRVSNILLSAKKANIEAQINDAVNKLSYIPLYSSKI